MLNPYYNKDFIQFLDQNTDRCSWIENWLTSNQINYSIIPNNSQKHIYINFSRESYNPLFKIKTILIHYDRIGIGANDNSAAVYQVLHWIKDLVNENIFHNMRVIFTDGEELGFSEEGNQQGALALANTFKRLGITSEDVYAIDTCGRGDVLVISSTGKNIGLKSFSKKFDDLYERTIELAKKSCSESWITIPVPYSDNAGFIASGIPAIAITVLPKDESTLYLRQLQRHNTSSEYYPETWKILHTDKDNINYLTESSWPLMQKFLKALSREKTLE